MRKGRLVAGGLLAAGLLAGCAGEWVNHPTQFSSWDHLKFSVKNQEGEAKVVTHRDLEEAKSEGWWGDVVKVTPDQVPK